MRNLKTPLILGSLVFALSACGGGDPELEAKIAENFSKQMYGSCSMNYAGSDVTAEQKEAVCNCVAEGMVEATDLPSDGMGERAKIDQDEYKSITSECEAKSGVSATAEG
ncbi:MAG: hypothetical protein ABJ242_08185 [Marinomonas sp.]